MTTSVAKVLSWNIRSGGKGRQAKVADAIRLHDPDVIVLGEYQPVGTAPLLTALAESGWTHAVATEPPGRRGGLAVVAKSPVTRLSQPRGLEAFAWRYVPVWLSQLGLSIGAVYAPVYWREPHEAFWTGFLSHLATGEGPDLILGDFNTGELGVDKPTRSPFCSQHFARLPAVGYIDAWRQIHGREAREHTWRSNRGSPYRLDHAFVATRFVCRVENCRYSHAERETQISDHSVLIVECARDADACVRSSMHAVL